MDLCHIISCSLNGHSRALKIVYMDNLSSTRSISDDTLLGKLRNPSEVYNFENPRSVLYGTETKISRGKDLEYLIN